MQDGRLAGWVMDVFSSVPNLGGPSHAVPVHIRPAGAVRLSRSSWWFEGNGRYTQHICKSEKGKLGRIRKCIFIFAFFLHFAITMLVWYIPILSTMPNSPQSK